MRVKAISSAMILQPGIATRVISGAPAACRDVPDAEGDPRHCSNEFSGKGKERASPRSNWTRPGRPAPLQCPTSSISFMKSRTDHGDSGMGETGAYGEVCRTGYHAAEKTARRGEKNGFTSTRRFLDVATGTADLAIGAGLAHPGIAVVGLDFMKEMLDVGRLKIAGAGLSGRVQLLLGDALSCPSPKIHST